MTRPRTTLVQRKPLDLGIRTLCRLMDDCLTDPVESERDMQQLINKLWPALVVEHEVEAPAAAAPAYVAQLERFIYDLTVDMGGGDMLAYSGAAPARHDEMYDLVEQIRAKCTPADEGLYLLPTEQVQIKPGASDWAHRNGFWPDELREDATVDGAIAAVLSAHRDGPDGAYYCVNLNDLPQITLKMPSFYLERV